MRNLCRSWLSLAPCLEPSASTVAAEYRAAPRVPGLAQAAVPHDVDMAVVVKVAAVVVMMMAAAVVMAVVMMVVGTEEEARAIGPGYQEVSTGTAKAMSKGTQAS
mmetsp:Transcript_18054/g.54330  ORF Transcript_18054/g.54330 Transcript_18054/m.54330 type:complete len:105 (+) Transcript_18054:198-512(+)